MYVRLEKNPSIFPNLVAEYGRLLRQMITDGEQLNFYLYVLPPLSPAQPIGADSRLNSGPALVSLSGSQFSGILSVVSSPSQWTLFFLLKLASWCGLYGGSTLGIGLDRCSVHSRTVTQARPLPTPDLLPLLVSNVIGFPVAWLRSACWPWWSLRVRIVALVIALGGSLSKHVPQMADKGSFNTSIQIYVPKRSS